MDKELRRIKKEVDEEIIKIVEDSFEKELVTSSSNKSKQKE